MALLWPIEERYLDELDLDLRNVRIPGGNLDQAAIANYLVEAAELLDLARDVLRDGYIDNELPVVTAEGGRLIVLEGNRRITALKAIHDPSILGKSARRMERLISRHPETDVPTRIRVMIAPTRESAQPLLARLHTRNPKKSWIREQQAVFYHAQLSPTVTVDDLKTLYPGEASSISSFIRMGEMRELIRSLRYDSAELDAFVQDSQLKMTSFEYAYDLPRVRETLGLQFEKDGLLVSKRLTNGQRRGLANLLELFRTKQLNTRSPALRASRVEHNALVEGLQAAVAGEVFRATEAENTATADPEPGPQDDGSNTSVGGAASLQGVAPVTVATNDAASETPPNRTDEPKTTSRSPARGDTRSRLNMEGFEYKGTSPGIRRRLEELRRLDVRDFPNASHDLLRTILECSIKDYFTSKSQGLPARTMLGTCVTELAKHYQNDRRMTSLINTINRSGRMPASQFAGTTTSLNASNHEPDTFVVGKDVHEAWERLRPILTEIVGK